MWYVRYFIQCFSIAGSNEKFVDVNICPIRLLTTQRNQLCETMISVGLVSPCPWLFMVTNPMLIHACKPQKHM